MSKKCCWRCSEIDLRLIKTAIGGEKIFDTLWRSVLRWFSIRTGNEAEQKQIFVQGFVKSVPERAELKAQYALG